MFVKLTSTSQLKEGLFLKAFRNHGQGVETDAFTENKKYRIIQVDHLSLRYRVEVNSKFKTYNPGQYLDFHSLTDILAWFSEISVLNMNSLDEEIYNIETMGYRKKV